MPTIVLSPGDVLKVQFDESDGAFEVHFDTTEHPNSVVVKEICGGVSGATLYHEEFSCEGFDEELNVPVETPGTPLGPEPLPPLHPADLELLQQAVKALPRGTLLFDVQWRIQHAQGKTAK